MTHGIQLSMPASFIERCFDCTTHLDFVFVCFNILTKQLCACLADGMRL
jgi:hypothetical protein